MMTRKENLIACLEDFNSHELLRIELVWTNGTRAGIANSRAKSIVMAALKEELIKQIQEEQ